ncbi:hypothetical protein PM082_013801 [Marasmius tenuissimus]|nr:hypothetical protein PM082_013801 [Marasmius tenuissimus]
MGNFRAEAELNVLSRPRIPSTALRPPISVEIASKDPGYPSYYSPTFKLPKPSPPAECKYSRTLQFKGRHGTQLHSGHRPRPAALGSFQVRSISFSRVLRQDV